MSALQAIIQGIIQGITEFLPISSSGHLVLYQHFFGQPEGGSVFFNIMLHLGTLVAVIAAFYEDVWLILKEIVACVRDIVKGRFSLKTNNPTRKLLFMLILATLPLVIVAFLNGFVTKISEDNDIIVEGICFLVTAALLFLACKMRPGKAGIRQMKPQSALGIGVMQGLAAMPGISRSGATISTGMLFGFDREFMVKFSFLLGIPAILGGAVFEIGDAAEQGITVSFGVIALGILSAAVFGYLSIFLVKKLVLSKRFIYFAYYTLVLGVIVILVGIVEHIIGAGAGGDASSAQSAISSISQAISDSGSAGSGSGAAALFWL